MKKSFFEKFGNEISFLDKDDLTLKFSDIDCSVPLRTEGRISDHRERYSLKIYMEKRADMDNLMYPVTVMKHETPDFIITQEDHIPRGLEHSEATTEAFQQISTRFESSPKDSLLEVSYFSERKRSRKYYNQAIKEPGQDLNGLPSYGDAWEKEWVDIVINVINSKTEKLNKPSYTKCDTHELMIYDNSHVMVKIDKALDILYNKYNKWKFLNDHINKFDIISVIYNQQLYYDVFIEHPGGLSE